jgi:transcriptional regulator with XRE-family HTH domain
MLQIWVTCSGVKTSEILRQARQEAGIGVRELARRTGVAESRISDYEHGRHEPSAARLQQLLEGTGHELVAVRRPGVDRARDGRIFADLLSLVDAMPLADLRRTDRTADAAPPTFAELTSPARR